MTPDEITAYIPLAKSIATRFARYGFPQEELFAEAMLGLCEAAHRYEPGRSSFAGYAGQWVFALVRVYTLKNRRIVSPPQSRAHRRAMAGLRRTEGRLMAQGSEPTTEALAEALGVGVEHIQDVERILSTGDAGLDVVQASGAPTPEDELIRLDTARKNLGLLTDRQRAALELMASGTLTFTQAGKRLGVSHESVRSRCREAVAAMEQAS